MEEQKRKEQLDDQIAKEFEVESQRKKEGADKVNFDFDFTKPHFPG